MMSYLILTTELRIFVLESVITMRARGDDLAHISAAQGFDIRLRALLKKKLVADPSRRVAGAGLFLAEHGKVHARFFE